MIRMKQAAWKGAMLWIGIALTVSGCRKEAETEDTRRHLTIMTYDYEGEPLKGEVGKEILEQVEAYTDTDLDISWVSSNIYSQKLSTILTYSKELPEIIVADEKSAEVLYAARNGKFWELSDYLGDYGNLSLTKKEILDNIRIDGNIYGIPRCRKMGRIGVGYRKDWAETLGLDEPKSVVDMEEMILKFTFADPDGNGIDDTYGLILSKDQSALDVVMSWFGVPNQWGLDEEGNVAPSFFFPSYMEAMDWIRALYEKGCINEDFIMRDTASWTDDLRNGMGGVISCNADDIRRVQDEFDFNGEGQVIDLVGAIRGNDGVRRTWANSGYNGFFVITKAAETEEDVRKCLEFLDKMNDPEMLLLTSHGVEGRHYTRDEDGSIVVSKDWEKNKEFGGLNQLVSFSNYDYEDERASTGLYKKQLEIIRENEKYIVKNPVLPFVNDSGTYLESGRKLEQMIQDARIEYIIGAIDKEEWEERVQEWYTSGGDRVIQELNVLYQERT